MARTIPPRLPHPRLLHSSTRTFVEDGAQQAPFRIRRSGIGLRFTPGRDDHHSDTRSRRFQARQQDAPAEQAPPSEAHKVFLKRKELQQKLNTGNGTHRPDWVCFQCGRWNSTKGTTCSKCNFERKPIKRWYCQQCRAQNPEQSLDCKVCHASTDTAAGPQTESTRRGAGDRFLRPDLNRVERAQESPVGASREVDPRRRDNESPPHQMQAKADEQKLQSSSLPQQESARSQSGEDHSYLRISEEYSELRRPELATRRRDEGGVPRAGVSADLSFLEESGDGTELNQLGINKDKERSPRQEVWTSDRQSKQPSGFSHQTFGADDYSLRSRPRSQQRQARQRTPRDYYADEGNPGEPEGHASRRDARKERRKRELEARKQASAPPTPIVIPEFISVTNLASLLKVRVEDFLSKMTSLGFDELNYDHVLDNETASLIAAEFNFEAVTSDPSEHDILPRAPAADKSVLPLRPPVVTIMGHVDHGKTTLLDYLRKSSIAASEHGGITQHIGAFIVPMSSSGRLITFLDTPGHEAFLSMRQRGANVTDIVILVVAADDSVKPQTIEAIKHAQTANVPMIVAINKVDKPDAEIERVKQDLGRYGVEIEDFGGDTQTVLVSGKTGQGIPELEDATVALSDILDLRAETDGGAEGWVLESTSSKSAGRVATVLIRRGTLKSGDVIVAGTSWARVRGLRNEAGAPIPFAGPGTPAEIDGWRSEPVAGDKVLPALTEQKAKDVVAWRIQQKEREVAAQDIAAVNEMRRLEQEKRDAEKRAEEAGQERDSGGVAGGATSEGSGATGEKEGGQKTLSLILKTDVSGSLDAVASSLLALSTPLIRTHILRSSVGSVTEFDLDVASASNSTIILFNTDISSPLRRSADEKKVRILEERIIYRVIEGVRGLMEGMLEPLSSKRVLGEAEVGQVFGVRVKGVGEVKVAGCRVRNGIIAKGRRVRVVRGGLGKEEGGEEVFDGTCFSLSFSIPLYPLLA